MWIFLMKTFFKGFILQNPPSLAMMINRQWVTSCSNLELKKAWALFVTLTWIQKPLALRLFSLRGTRIFLS